MSRLSPDLARRFRSGRACLDLVHTGGEGELARWEIIHGSDDLARFLGVILGLAAVRATVDDLAEMRLLRAAITHVAYGLAAGVAPRVDDIMTINRHAAAPPLTAALVSTAAPVSADPVAIPFGDTDSGPRYEPVGVGAAPVAGQALADPRPPFTVRATVVDPTAPAALGSLARDAVDLFGGPLASRIRVCAAADCGLLLVDTSRPGRRRWCSMQRCGNRAKIREHRARRTAD